MNLTKKIKKEIQIYRQTLTCPNGHFISFEWKDENGDTWSSYPFTDYKAHGYKGWQKKEERSMKDFLKFVSENKTK